MALICPPKHLPVWKKLVEAVGEDAAYIDYQQNNYEVRDYSLTDKGKPSKLFNEIKSNLTEKDAIQVMHKIRKFGHEYTDESSFEDVKHLVNVTEENVRTLGLELNQQENVDWETTSPYSDKQIRIPQSISDIRQAQRFLQERFPNNDVLIYESIKRVGSEVAHGYFKNAAFHLWSDMAPGTQYHEAFHGAFRMYLSEVQQRVLLQEASKKYKIGMENPLAIEEAMAEDFRKYVMSDGEHSVTGRIAEFFRNLYAYIKAIVSDSLTIDQTFRLLKGNKFPPRFQRSLERYKPSTQELYSLRPGFTVAQQDAIINTIVTKILDIRQELENRKLDAGPQRVLANTKHWFLRNAFSDADGQPISFKHALKVVKLYQEHAEAKKAVRQAPEDKRAEFEALEAAKENEINEYLEKHDLYQSVSDLAPDIPMNHDIFLDIYNHWDDLGSSQTGNVSIPGWEKLVLRRLPDYGLEVKGTPKIQVSELEVRDLDIDFANTSEETIRKIWDRTHFEESMRDKMSGDVRRFITTIKKNTVNQLGFNEFYSSTEIWGDLAAITADAHTPGEMIQRLTDQARFKPRLRQIVERYEALDNNTKTKFFQSFRTTLSEFLTLTQERNFVTDETTSQHGRTQTIKLANSMMNSLRQRIRNNYADNAFEGEMKNDRHLYKEKISEHDNTYLEVNEARIQEMKDPVKRLDEYMLSAKKELSEQNIKDFQTVIAAMGMMDNTSRTLSNLTTYFENGDTIRGVHYSGKELMRALYHEGPANQNRAIKTLVSQLASFDTSAGGRVMEITGVTEATSPVDIYSEEVKVINSIVNIDLQFLEGEAGSFVNSMGKSIYPINMPTTLSDNITKIKKGTYFTENDRIDYFEGDAKFNPIPAYPAFKSIYYDILLNNEDIRQQFNLTTFESYKKKGEQVAQMDYGELHFATSLSVRLNHFLNNSNASYARMVLPTQADRSRADAIQVPRVNTIANGNSLTKMYGVELRQLFERYLMQDTVRIQRERQFIRENEKDNPGALIPTWHTKQQNALKYTQIQAFEDIVLDADKNIRFTDIDFDAYYDGQDTNPVSRAVISDAIQQQLDRAAVSVREITQDVFDNLHKNQIISNKFVNGEYVYLDGNGKVTTSIDRAEHTLDTVSLKKFYPQDTGNIKDIMYQLSYDFAINDIVFRNEMTKILRGDRGYARDYANFIKRFGTLTTPGLKPVIQGDIAENWGLPEKFTNLTIHDVKNFTQSMDFYNMMLQYNKAHAEGYKPGNVNKSDAQGFMSIDFWRNWMQSIGEWRNDLHEVAYQNYKRLQSQGQIGRFVTPDGRVPPVVPIKPYYEKLMPHPETGALTPYTIKNSYVVLFEEFTNDKPVFENVRRRMESQGQYEGLTPISVVNTDTTHKLAMHNVAEVIEQGTDAEGNPTYSPANLSNAVPVKMDSDGFFIPQTKPTSDKVDKKNNFGSQLLRIGISGVKNSTSNYLFNHDIQGTQAREYTGQQMFDLYQHTVAEQIRDSIESVKKELHLDYQDYIGSDKGKAAKKKFLEALKSKMMGIVEQRGLPSNYEKALDIVASPNGGFDFRIPMSFPSIAKKFEQALFSIFRNEIMTQKMNVKNVVQMAELGGHVTRGDLKFVANPETGALDYAEVAVSSDVAKALGLNKGETLEQLPERLSRFVGYRVPTQGKNSSLPFRIVEILPEGYEATIMVPGEITEQMGSDFDVDSLYLLLRNSERTKEGELIFSEPEYDKVFKEDGTVDTTYLKNLDRATRENIVSDVLESVLRSKQHFSEITTSLESATIASLANEAIEKYNAIGQPIEETLNPNNPLAEVDAQVRNRDGSSGIGVYANQQTGHVTNVGTEAQLSSDLAIKIDGEYYSRVYVERDTEGNLVENNISQHITSSVDNANDQHMHLLNDNVVTQPVTAILLSVGLPISQVVQFRNHPIMRQFVEYYNRSQELKSMPQMVTQFAQEYVNPEFEVSAEVKNMDGFRLADYTGENRLGDGTVLSNFVHFHTMGKDLMKLNKVSTPNRISDMSTLSAIYEFQNIENYVRNENRFSIENVESILSNDHYEINKAFMEGLSTAIDFSSRIFPYQEVAVQNLKDHSDYGIKALLNKEELNKEQHDAIHQFVFLDIMSRPDGPLADTFTTERARELLMDKDNNIAAKLREIKKAHPKLQNNPFAKHLQEHFGNRLRGESLFRIKFDNSYSYTQDQKNNFTNGLYEMLFMPEIYSATPQTAAEVSQFARDIIDFGMLAYGFSPAGESFIDLIPVEFWESVKTPEGKSAIDFYYTSWAEMHNGSNPDMLAHLSDTFIRSHLHVPGLIPYVERNGTGKTMSFPAQHYEVFQNEKYLSYIRAYNTSQNRMELFVFQEINQKKEAVYAKTQPLGERFKLNELNLTDNGQPARGSIHPAYSKLKPNLPGAPVREISNAIHEKNSLSKPEVAKRDEKRLTPKPHMPPFSTTEPVQDKQKYGEEITGHSEPDGITLTPHQNEALDRMRAFLESDRQMGALKGRGGTGKTTIIKHILADINPKDIVYIAPTHKAKLVLSSMAGKQANTLASALLIDMNESTGKFEPNTYRRRRETMPLTTGKYVVIDESSMISDVLLQEIKDNILPHQKVIFMGDNAQLPPIGQDADSSIFGYTEAELTEVIRQAEDSPILGYATQLAENIEGEQKLDVIEGGQTTFDGETNKGIIFSNDAHAFLDMWQRDFQANPESTKVVTFNNERHSNAQSVLNMNRVMRERLFGKNPDFLYEGEQLTAYDSLMDGDIEILLNSVDYTVKEFTPVSNYSQQVVAVSKKLGRRTLTIRGLTGFNTLLVNNITGKEVDVFMPDNAGRALIEKHKKIQYDKGDKQMGFKIGEAFANLHYGYAITSHKSQGSTYRNVYVMKDNILHSDSLRKPKNKNQSLYVAVSRASDKSVIFTRKAEASGREYITDNPNQETHLRTLGVVPKSSVNPNTARNRSQTETSVDTESIQEIKKFKVGDRVVDEQYNVIEIISKEEWLKETRIPTLASGVKGRFITNVHPSENQRKHNLHPDSVTYINPGKVNTFPENMPVSLYTTGETELKFEEGRTRPSMQAPDTSTPEGDIIDRLSLEEMSAQRVVGNKINELTDTFAKHGVQVQIIKDNTIEGLAQVEPAVDGVFPIRMKDQAFSAVETQIHEFGHIYIDMLGYDNPIIQQGVNQLRGSELWGRIERLYEGQFQHLSPSEAKTALAKEVLATAIGIEGANYLNQPWWKAWWNRFVNGIKNLFGLEINVARQLSTEMLQGKLRVTGMPRSLTPYIQSQKDTNRANKVDSLKVDILATLERQLAEMGQVAPQKGKDSWRLKREDLRRKIREAEDGLHAITEYINTAYSDMLSLMQRFDTIKSLPADQRVSRIKELANINNYLKTFEILPNIKTELLKSEDPSYFQVADSKKPAHILKLEKAAEMYDIVQSDFIEVAIPAMTDALFPYFHERATAQLQKHIEQIEANPDRLPGIGHWRRRKEYQKILADERNGILSKEEAKQKKSEFLVEQMKNRLPTRANLIRWLTEAEKDRDTYSFWMDPEIYSSDQAIQVFTLFVKDAMMNVHDRTLSLRNKMVKDYQTFRQVTGREGFDQAKTNEGLYETVVVEKFNEQTGQTDEVEVLSFVQPYKVGDFRRNRRKFFTNLNEKYKKPKDAEEALRWQKENPKTYEQYSKEKRKWYQENTVPVDNWKEIVQAKEAEVQAIRERIKQLKELRKSDQNVISLDEKIQTQELKLDKAQEWFQENYNYKIPMRELVRPATGEGGRVNYTNEKWTELQKPENKHLKEYYDKLMQTYVDSQSLVGFSEHHVNPWDSHSYLVPSVRKSQKDILIEDGAIEAGREYIDSTTILETDEQYGVLDTVDQDSRKMPVFYTKPQSHKRITRDLAGAVLKHAHMAIGFNEKSNILSHVQLMKTIINNRPIMQLDESGNVVLDKFYKMIGKDKPRQKTENIRSIEAFNAFIDNVFYGIRDQKVKKTVPLTNRTVELNKVANKANSMAANLVFPLNFLQGVANVNLGNTYIAAEAAAKEFFGRQGYLAAKAELIRNFPAMMADMGKGRPVNKVFVIAEMFDMQRETSMEQLAIDTFGSRPKNLSSMSTAFFIQRIGEFEMAITPGLAMMKEFKVRDKDGNTIKTENGQDMNLFDAYKYDSKADTFVLDSRVANFTKQDMRKMMNTIHGINRKLQGIYNQFDRPHLKSTWLGKMIILFRSWFGPNLRRAWGFGDGIHVDHEIGAITEGIYISALRYLRDSVTASGNFYSAYHNLTDMERMNVNRVMVQKLQVAIAMVVVAMLRPDLEEDEQNTFAQNFLLYQARRNQAELTVFARPFTEGLKILRSPAATMMVLERTRKFVQQVLNPMEEYQRKTGRYEAGDKKIVKRTIDMIPLLSALERSRTPYEAFQWFDREI